jgi:hypothetical protein
MPKATRYIIICITLGFVALTVAKSFLLAKQHGLVDLRTRIVGTRLITTEHSPYFYKWDRADGERYLDPIDEAGRLVNGNVVTPATMMVMYPLSKLDYPRIAIIWTALQLLAGFIIIYLLFRQKTISVTITQSALIVLGLICSDYWFYNIESGQIYIFYTLFFAAMYKAYISTWKHNHFISGFIGGLFIFFRPVVAIFGLSFLLHWKPKWIIGCIAGAGVGFLVFVLPQWSLWQDYLAAMQAYSNEIFGTAQPITNVVEPLKPDIIEGAANLRIYSELDLGRLDILYHFFQRFGITITYAHCVILLLVAVLGLSFFFYRQRKSSSPVKLFLFGFLLYMVAELFMPAPRQVYNVIQWLFPLSLIYLYSKKNIPVLVILITGLLLLHHFPFPFAQQGKLAELIFLGLTFYCIYFSRRRSDATPVLL